MENKKLLKFLNEIEKLDFNNLNFISDLNKFQFDVLLYLKKNQKSTIKFLIEKINKEFSRAQKYRLIDELISKKICKKKKHYLFLNL
ncbi:MAG: hypothetical protein CL393_10385 [Acidiferrobacteraceae bacterium]|mgnify:FL=1|jgi:predicted transcriptional regulator|nr:hypothetical protein [Acidiferrobacteraceae bacterium]|tara:strand:- start:900 stop:1160 length:261 start_codon:yes stop_codon:yes gene_type:complete